MAARTPPSVDLVRDLCQEIFLRTFQALPAFSFRSSFTTWLFKLTRNRVLDELRALERRQRRATTYEHDAIRTVDPPSERLELLDAIWRAIGTLNGDLKMALLLRDLVGLSYSEIAESLEITLPTVKWRIHKARSEVVRYLRDEGLLEETTDARPPVVRSRRRALAPAARGERGRRRASYLTPTRTR